MAPIVTSIDVARPPEEVFGYVIDPSLFVELQEGVVSGRMEGDGPHGGRTMQCRRDAQTTTARNVHQAAQLIRGSAREFVRPFRSWIGPYLADEGG